MDITVIHPSRGRAEQAYLTWEKFNRLAKGNINYYLSIEPDQKEAYLKYFPENVLFVHQNSTAIEAINNTASKIDFELLVVVSDDFDCFSDWDFKVKQAVKGKENFVLKTFDGLQKWIVTLPIMDKAYYDSFGYVYYPGYSHLFCDTELTTVAEYTDRLIIRNDIVFNHKTINDAQHKGTDSTWKQGEKLYLERFKINFGVEKKKEISCPNHLRWLQRHF